MELSVEPIAGWFVGAFMLGCSAVVAIYGKRVAQWVGTQLAKGVVNEIGDALEPRWVKLLEPINAELRINDGAEKWPNGSSSLHETMQTIYDRQSDTHKEQGDIKRMVGEMQRQLEEVLTTRPPRPDLPGGTPQGF